MWCEPSASAWEVAHFVENSPEIRWPQAATTSRPDFDGRAARKANGLQVTRSGRGWVGQVRKMCRSLAENGGRSKESSDPGARQTDEATEMHDVSGREQRCTHTGIFLTLFSKAASNAGREWSPTTGCDDGEGD